MVIWPMDSTEVEIGVISPPNYSGLPFNIHFNNATFHFTVQYLKVNIQVHNSTFLVCNSTFKFTTRYKLE